MLISYSRRRRGQTLLKAMKRPGYQEMAASCCFEELPSRHLHSGIGGANLEGGCKLDLPCKFAPGVYELTVHHKVLCRSRMGLVACRVHLHLACRAHAHYTHTSKATGTTTTLTLIGIGHALLPSQLHPSQQMAHEGSDSSLAEDSEADAGHP